MPRSVRKLPGFALVLLCALWTAGVPAPHAVASSADAFDFTRWKLQLPIGTPGRPRLVSSASLQGAAVYHDQYFHIDPADGSLVMRVPPKSSGCVTTPHSQHCRTELSEVDPASGRSASWDPRGPVNTLQATLRVIEADDGTHGTVVGQVHMSSAVSTKPVCELYYDARGDLTAGVEQSRDGRKQVYTRLGNVPLGQAFSYEIDYSHDILRVAINGTFTTLPTGSLDAPPSYFKAGNYNQGSDASEVRFSALRVEH